MNQLITLLDGALQANLSKRQWAAFAAVLRQTLGYRKTEDDLSARRLEQLTGIRRNHIWQAKGELVAMELLVSRRGKYGEVLGFKQEKNTLTSTPRPVSKRQSEDEGEVYCTAPKTGQPDSQIRPKPVPKRDTTVSNLTQSNHDNSENAAVVAKPVDESALQYPNVLSDSERQQAPHHLDGLSPTAAQQVLDVWAHKISRGEVRKSRIGLLIALVKAQRGGTLNTDALPQNHSASDVSNPQQQRQREREEWLEQQAQQGWLRDMARLSGLPPDKLRGGSVGLHAAGGVS